jgi:hypothetical protein
MAESEKAPAAKPAGKKTARKGGRKGGTTFPRINLERALKYADKLVSKTHTGPLPESQILAGVFGSSGPDCQVRASALKQYGLLEGDKTAYKATPLAQVIDAALDEEKSGHLQKALLSSKLFQDIFQTFQDDSISRAKIKQRAQGLKVHPDSADECAGIFMDSAVTAGLGTMDGESIKLVKAGVVEVPVVPIEGEEIDEAEGEVEPEITEENDEAGEGVASSVAAAQSNSAQKQRNLSTSTKSVVNVNLTVDPSSDPDRLEKQLKLL